MIETMKNHHIKITRMDSGRTVGVCDDCGERRESGAPDEATAKQEIDRMFEGHDCSKTPKEKTP